MAGIGQKKPFILALAIAAFLVATLGCQHERKLVRQYNITCSPGTHPAVYRNQPRGGVITDSRPPADQSGLNPLPLPGPTTPSWPRPSRQAAQTGGQSSLGAVASEAAAVPEPEPDKGEPYTPEPGEPAASPERSPETTACRARTEPAPESVSPATVRPVHILCRRVEPEPETYHVGQGDTLDIRVFQLTELGRDQTFLRQVDPQGNIHLPVLGQVAVAEMTCEQIKETLVRQLRAGYLRAPQVAVAITQYSSKIVQVLGAVAQPGPVCLRADTVRLGEVIAEAGGVRETASQVEILRPTEARRQIVPIARLFATDADQVNPLIRAGDIVRVAGLHAGYIYVAGEVRQPGAKRLRHPFDILQAVTCAGGTTSVADQHKCRVIRRTPEGQERVMIVDLKRIAKGEQPNVLLTQNDTVIVPINHGKKFWADLGGLFQRSVATGTSMGYSAAPGAGLGDAAAAY